MNVYKRTRCRLCDSNSLELACPLRPTPVAEKYGATAQEARQVPVVRLDLYRCEDCAHVQILDIVDASFIFDQTYTYRTGQTQGIVEHFRHYAAEAWEHCRLAPGDMVIEIGSNDGTLLNEFKSRGARVLGIDPAATIAREANERGIETLSAFFTAELATRIRADHGAAKLVVANNVFAHADDLQEIADGVSHLLSSDGLFKFEISYLMDILDKCLLGTIFHEHVSYHALHPMCRFLHRHDMEICHAQRNTIQGGSLVLTAKPINASRSIDPSVPALLALEEQSKLNTKERLRDFSTMLDELKDETQQFVGKAKLDGKTIAGFGAARSGTTLIAQLDLANLIDYIFDNHPDKVGRFTAGFGIPVLPTSAITSKRPDYLFILAWIHASKIIENNREFVSGGGRWVTCVPDLRIIPPFN